VLGIRAVVVSVFAITNELLWLQM